MGESVIKYRSSLTLKCDRTCLLPSYIIIQFEQNVKIETVQWIVDRIQGGHKNGGAELLVMKQPSLKKYLTLHVSATPSKLLELAEELDVRKRDERGALKDFTITDIKDVDLLTTAEKQNLVRHELENIRALLHEKFVPGYPDIHLYEGQSILSACLHWGLLRQVFPLHDEEEIRKLGSRWFMTLFQKQPFEEIRAYFGESVALYFQFLGFYTYALFPPMILGFYQLFLAPETLAFFCIVNVIWAAIIMEAWRMKCTELAYMWGTISMTSTLDEPRPNYRGVMYPDDITGRIQPYSPRWKTYVKMYCVSLPLVVLCMLGAFVVMLASFWLEELLRSIPDYPNFVYLLPSIGYAGLIYVMNTLYRWFANHLTEWENHRTQSQFDRHRVTKLVLFEFVNNFMSLFYIAFIYQDMEMLRSQLATLLIILQLINNFQEAALPLLLQSYYTKMSGLFSASEKKRRPSADDRTEPKLDVEELDPDDPRVMQVIRESQMDPYEDPYDDYLELFVQFGYVFLFSSVYPMAAFWAVANNILEIRSDAFKLCCVYQRPMARRVKDTGAWQRAFQALCALSVMTNCALLCLSSTIRNLAPNMSPTEWVLLFVGLEHVLLGIRQVLHYAIPDKPEWVRIALAKLNYQSKQALRKQRLQRRRNKVPSTPLPTDDRGYT